MVRDGHGQCVFLLTHAALTARRCFSPETDNQPVISSSDQ